MVDVLTIETPSLGDRSYLATDGRVAVVVDPQRDTERVLALAAGRGVAITHVAETHVHNDYVTGGLALARRAGAKYLVNAADAVEFERTPVSDGDRVPISDELVLRVLATPGHTFTHLAYVLEERGEAVALFSGGSLLYGATGRPDLLGTEHTSALARQQHASARRLLAELPPGTPLYPTHGFGSFCAATPLARAPDGATLAAEAARNPALTLDVDDFLAVTLAGLDDFPAYYSRMGPRNLAGPAEPDLSPPAPAAAGEIRRRLAAGEWVIDLRVRAAYAAGHVRGAYFFGVDGRWVSYLGWLIPSGTPLTLLAATPDDVADAQRELVRIGIERPASAATGDAAAWAAPEPLVPLRRASFADLAGRLEEHAAVRAVVLDVRRRTEYEAGHVSGAVHIPLHHLPSRLADVPPGEVWVHCGSGYRATIAASFLQAAGRAVVVVDDRVRNAAAAGLAFVTRAPR